MSPIRYRLEKLLVFDVCNAPAELRGLPCFKPDGQGGYTWVLPPTYTEVDFDIGWELGVAFLRARRLPGGVAVSDEIDPAPLELAMIATTMSEASTLSAYGVRGVAGVSEGYHDGFYACLGVFQDHAINAPHTLPALLKRLEALDDEALRARCLAALYGKPVADIFEPDGLWWSA